MHLRFYIVTVFALIGVFNFAQQTQGIRGKVLDAFSNLPIEGVVVEVLLEDSIIKKGVSNSKGVFFFSSIELGIYDLSFSHSAYTSFILPEVVLYSSREAILEVSLEERFEQLETFIVRPKKDRTAHNNDMATLSTKTIYVQDVGKLAGSLDDPIRVAGTLPGVTSDAAFSENFISIRGNSPRGLKYVMDGIELPNPSHFARIGSSGGTFTIFSLRLLGKSDFFTGAFPAEYSDALSGVFDVNFRKGNIRSHEFSIQAGTLGLDLSAEGPMGKSGNEKSSYLINYRYATVGLARLIGYPTQPTYQDLSFNFNFITDKGAFNLFGISGMSDRSRLALTDRSTWEGDLDRYNLLLRSDVFTIGGTYDHTLSANSTLKATLLGSYTHQVDNKNYLLDDYTEITRSVNQYSSIPLSGAFSFRHRFGKYHSNKTGFTVNQTHHNWQVEKYDFERAITDTLVAGKGLSYTVKGFSQSKLLFSDRFSANLGLAYLWHSVNNKGSLEPRLGLIYTTRKEQKIALAMGKHSQIEHFATYLYQTRDTLGDLSAPNKNLDFVKAYHIIGSYGASVFKNHYLKAEVYYQYLYDVPVEFNNSFSMINVAELDDVRALTNQGTGANYGLDVGLERYSSKGLYYMINASLFESKYIGGDGVERSTEFDQKFNLRFLAGKEYIVGEKKGKRNYLGWNTNLAYVGGRPYTPVDIDGSITAQETVYDESLAFTQREDNLLFLDVTFTYKVNKSKRTGILSLQLKNLFSNGNAVYREYDNVLGKEVVIPSSSFFPNLSYRLDF